MTQRPKHGGLPVRYGGNGDTVCALILALLTDSQACESHEQESGPSSGATVT